MHPTVVYTERKPDSDQNPLETGHIVAPKNRATAIPKKKDIELSRSRTELDPLSRPKQNL